jgi:hypothetical protein
MQLCGYVSGVSLTGGNNHGFLGHCICRNMPRSPCNVPIIIVQFEPKLECTDRF